MARNYVQHANFFLLSEAVKEASEMETYMALNRSSHFTEEQGNKNQRDGVHPLNLWEKEGFSIIPKWMKDYFTWHKQQLSLLNETRNNTEHRIFVMRCLHRDDECGGASDRLQSIPFAIRVAAKYKRLLFIKWERPAPLEEFLLPPQGGLDWRIPEWLDEQLSFGGHPTVNSVASLSRLNTSDQVFMADMLYQSWNHGSQYYNENLEEDEASFEMVYNDVWRMLFEPAPPIRALIHQLNTDLELLSGPLGYTSLHIRAKYAHDKTTDRPMIENAIHCAFALNSNHSTVFIASDNANATRYAIEYAKQFGKAVARLDEKEPLHLDRAGQYLIMAPNRTGDNFTATDFYDTWLDLFLMSGGRCVSEGIGGFAKWAGMIGNAKKNRCINSHAKKKCRRPDVLAV